jgi:hypothetical protein
MNDNGTPEIKIATWGTDPKGVFEHLLCHGGVLVMVEVAAAGVVLPPHLHDKPRVVLQYELEPVVPIPDLDVTVEGIRATLSFSREPFATFVPWAAVIVMAPMRPAQLEEKPKRPKLRAV